MQDLIHPDALFARIAARVTVQPDGCWLAGDIDGHYPSIQIGGNDGVTVALHRLVYALTTGPIPPGHEVDHACHWWDPTCPGADRCRHHRCCAPTHLRTLTRAQNAIGAGQTRHRNGDVLFGGVGRVPGWVSAAELAILSGRAPADGTRAEVERAAEQLGRELGAVGLRSTMRRIPGGDRRRGYAVTDLERYAPDFAAVC